MKTSSTFVPATQVQQLSSVLCNFSCLDNPVDWGSYLFGGGSYGVATLPLGLFIFSPIATLYNELPHRNHPARTAANTTHTFSAPRPNPKQDGPATCSHGIRVSPANGAPETSNRNDGAGQLPASITFAAIPPAAFFHTNFVNLACSVEGRG